MAFTGERKDAEIAAALKESKGTDEAKKVFASLDQDKSGFFEKDKPQQNFAANTHVLPEAETKAYLQAGDADGEGKIGAEEFVALVDE